MPPCNVMLFVSILVAAGQSAPLQLQFIGNAGVLLSDGVTSLLVDVPYQSGAFGYMEYDLESAQPSGRTVSVITHAHSDHFDADLFLKTDWTVIAPPGVQSLLPAVRVLSGDSLRVGAFSVVAVRTPHTPEHRSYRIRWRGRVLYFTGDTEDIARLTAQPPLDVVFITPWLSCALARSGAAVNAVRAVAYHQAPNGSDRLCASARPMRQGESFVLQSVD